MKTDIIKDLEEIIDSGLEQIVLPYSRGNSIRLKNYIIRKGTNGYLIYNCEDNKQIARTFFKTTAVAIVKNLVEGKNIISRALKLDSELLKHYNDAVFYKQIIKNATDIGSKEIRKARLGISIDQSKYIRQQLDDFIF
jgi:hypothetical protein